MLIELQKEEEIINLINKNHELLIIKFSTEWCSPCKRLKIIFEQLLKENINLIVIEIDLDKFPLIAKKIGIEISVIPTIILFSKGIIKKIKSGSMEINELKEFIYN